MGKRILVADDSLTIQQAFAMVLDGSGYALSFAKSVDEALAMARSNARPDLVLADIALGTGSGYDLCAAIKAEASLQDVPVFILESGQSPYDETQGRRVGADGHLAKPFESQSLLDAVASALASPPSPASSALPQSVADLGEDTARISSSDLPAEDDDSYGEITIERGPAPSATVPGWGAKPATWPAGARPVPSAATPGTPAGAPSPRPSLIPGARPAAATPAPRPGSTPQPATGPVTPRPPLNRTMMGFPSVKPPVTTRPAAATDTSPQARVTPVAPTAAAPSRPVVTATPPAQAVAKPAMPAPSVPFPSAASRPVVPRFSPPPPSAPVSSSEITRKAPTPIPRTTPAAPASLASTSPGLQAVSSLVDEKVAALAARGPEYEAIAKLSREIIEQVVWEVVPELAETIIRQEVDRQASAKN